MPDSVTDYQRFLLHQARFNVEYGEDVRYLRRARADALDLPDRDFWVFDSAALLLMPFTADDRLLDCEIVTDPELVARHEAWIDLAMAHASPMRSTLPKTPPVPRHSQAFESFRQVASHGEDAVGIVHRLMDALGDDR